MVRRRTDMPSASAASVMFRPAKKRSVTSRAACASTAAKQFQCVIQGEYVFDRLGSGDGGFVEVLPLSPASAFGGLAAPGLIDQDAAHGLGSSGEEMALSVPLLSLVHVHKPQIGPMY